MEGQLLCYQLTFLWKAGLVKLMGTGWFWLYTLSIHMYTRICTHTHTLQFNLLLFNFNFIFRRLSFTCVSSSLELKLQVFVSSQCGQEANRLLEEWQGFLRAESFSPDLHILNIFMYYWGYTRVPLVHMYYGGTRVWWRTIGVRGQLEGISPVCTTWAIRLDRSSLLTEPPGWPCLTFYL